MKVSVITMHNYPNYGSVLQALATQEKLGEYADEVEIIDYSGGDSTVGRNMIKYMSIGFGANPVKAFVKLPVRLRQRTVYDGFARRYLNLTARRYTTDKDFTEFAIESDIYCTGSDQVWNPFFDENMPFFLNFIPAGKRKFAYAVSFGNYMEERLSPVQADRVKKYVDQYENISVREERGLKILQEQLGYTDAVQLVDPTLAVTPEFWRNLAPKSRIDRDYILLYKLGKEKPFESFAKGLSGRTSLPVVRFCSQSFGQLADRGCRKILLPPVLDFISLIDNAKYIVTDSFHGAALAMLLNTEPIVYREEYDGDRISGFLRLVGHEYRYIKDCDDFGVIDRPTDFDHVNVVLARERERVASFLGKVFGHAV